MLSFKYSEGKYVRTEEEITCKLPHWHYMSIYTYCEGQHEMIDSEEKIVTKINKRSKASEENLIHKLHISVWTKSEIIEETWK